MIGVYFSILVETWRCKGVVEALDLLVQAFGRKHFKSGEVAETHPGCEAGGLGATSKREGVKPAKPRWV